MLGIDHSHADEKMFNLISKVSNPSTGLLLTDEIDITLWASNILADFVTEAKDDKDLVLKLESEIKKLKGEELNKVMRYITYLLLNEVSKPMNRGIKLMEKERKTP